MSIHVHMRASAAYEKRERTLAATLAGAVNRMRRVYGPDAPATRRVERKARSCWREFHNGATVAVPWPAAVARTSRTP